MKVSLNTIKQYTSVDISVDELVQKLNQQLGGVEEVIDLRKKYEDAVIVRVLSAVKHDNADKLSVCVVDDGGVVQDVERDGDGHVQVVCGAPNVHGDMFAVWLPPRATVPASFNDEEPFVLDAREIRGVRSNGMLAAADELAIGTDHEGIIEINPEEWRPYDIEIKPGASFAAAYGLDDTIIDIENKMFTHRPDCFGQLGVAREIAGIQQQKFVSPEWYVQESPFEQASGLELTVTNSAEEVVPRFMAVALKDIEVKSSPLWLQCALVALGSKPINNIVDVTNYVMLITGQPLHAYDYDKLRGHKLGVRLAKDGEQLPLLNGKTYTCDPSDIVIVDGEGPVGMGGVMGGGNSEVSAETKNIVLEAATFDMYSIRKTSMRHGLFTDAVTRFNKGQSPLQNAACLYLAMQSIFDTAGGAQATDVFDEGVAAAEPPTVHTTAEFINARLGLSLEAEAIAGLLANVEFSVDVAEDGQFFTAPFWRTDIELPEDVVEEVGRLYGFDKLPRELPMRSIKPASTNPQIALKQTIRRVLAGAGANEVLTYSFVHERTLKGANQDPATAYKLGNALSPDLQYYRLTIIPSLLDHIHSNVKAGHDQFVIFEIGKGHTKDDLGEDGLPVEYECVAGVVAAKKADGAAFYQAKRLVTELLDKLGLAAAVTYAPFEPKGMAAKAAYFAPGRAATFMVGDEPIGRVGEFLPNVRRTFKLPEYCAGFELNVAKLLKLASAHTYTPLSRYPYVTQDISLSTPAEVSYGELLQLVQSTLDASKAPDTVSSIKPLTIYQPDGSDRRTITFRIRIASYDKTLTDTEVNSYLDAIGTATAEQLNATRA